MQPLFFWKEWPRPFKELYYFLFITFGASIIWMLYAYFQGTSVFIDWNILGDTEKTDVAINTFRIGPFTLSTSAENTIFYQRFQGSLPAINALSYYIFLVVTIIAANILLTIVTTLSRFWYYVGVALFAYFLVNLKLELLLLFDSELKIGLITALILFLPTSYYFNVINTNISFIKRLGVFSFLTVLMAILIYFSAGVASPFFHVATSGMINPMIISSIFILLVANEIISWMIYIITNANTTSSKNTLWHFCILVIVYMANLVLAYFHETRAIDWDILYVNLFLLLLISAILGVWGYQQREEQYNYLFGFLPIGAIFYITMGVCCFVTISHLMTTGNDAGLEVFRDMILYGHIGFGVIFILYIIANFIAPLKNNLKVYKVLYHPTGMPYFTFRLAGTIAVAALFLRANWEVPVNQSIAGYYNSLGDLHRYIDETPLAQQYYKEATEYGYNNHKANYTLAYLLQDQDNAEEATKYYENATQKWPSPQSFINLGNLRHKENGFFEGLFVLQEGLKAFPDNAQIQNNLALLYGKTDILDSTLLYFDQAYQNKQPLAASNILAMVAKNHIRLAPDSILSDYEIANDPISVNNRIVLNSNSAEPANITYSPDDSTLSLIQASILYNNAFNHLFDEDSLVTEDLYQYANLSRNVNFRESLHYIASLNHYKNLDINKAFRRLNWLANRLSANSGKYFDHVGLWALEQNAPDVAVDYFRWALDEGFEEARLHLAIALTENQNIREALAVWQSLAESGDSNTKTMALNLISLLQLKPDNAAALSDNQKYLYLRYHTTAEDTILFNDIVPTITSPDYRAEAVLNMAEKLWKLDLSEAAVDYYTRLSDLQISDKNLFERIQFFELKLLATEGSIRGLAQKINQGIEFSGQHLFEKYHYTALLNEASGDTTNALMNYRNIGGKNPFNVEATIASASFIGYRDRFEGYNILLNALEINPRSVLLLKAYILQCARVQLENYAENSFEVLTEIISPKELSEFRKEYVQLVKAVKEAEDTF